MQESTPYKWTSGYSKSGIMGGLFFCGIALTIWNVNASSTLSGTSNFALVVVVAIFAGFGTLFIGFRTEYLVFPADQQIVRQRRFFGINVNRQSWVFADIKGVELFTVGGPKGARSLSLQLTQCLGGDDIVMNTYFMGSKDNALADAHRLADVLGVPFNESDDTEVRKFYDHYNKR